MPPSGKGKQSSVPKLPWQYCDDLPDSQTQTMAWVRATDAKVTIRFDPSRPLDHDWDRGQPESWFTQQINEDVLQEIVNARRLACNNQLALSQTITEFFAEDDFEVKWISDPARQKRLLLETFKHADADKGYNVVSRIPEKLNCPELCWEELMRDQGRGFLDLVQRFLLDNNDVPPTSPILLPNSRFDEIIGWVENDPFQARKARLEMRRIMRTEYIAAIIGMTFTLYLGRKIQHAAYTHEKHKTKTVLQNFKPALDDMLGPAGSKSWRRDAAENRKEMKLFCANCLKAEDKEAGHKMSVCAKCHAIDRYVRYCNRDCQKAAWKQHKRECGKPLSISSLFDDVAPVSSYLTRVTPRSDIPSPHPGYRRTPDLLRLIGLLNQSPRHDYIVIVPVATRPKSDPDLHGISLDEVQGAATFIAMRSRAVCSGDPAALLYMFRVLMKQVSAGDIDVSTLRSQLLREYGAPFENLLESVGLGKPPPIPKIGVPEIEVAMVELKKAGRFKEELASFTPGQGGETVTLGMQVGPDRALSAYIEISTSALPPMVTLLPLSDTSLNIVGRSGKGSTSGPNHLDPTPREGYIRSLALKKQMEFLKANPLVDYVLYGQESAPKIPHSMTFNDPMACVAFLSYRQRLFKNGGGDLDALAFFLMTVEPAVRRRKVSRVALIEQLSLEYGASYVEEVVRRINGNKYARPDAEFLVGEIPAKEEDMLEILPRLKDVGRFSVFLESMKL